NELGLLPRDLRTEIAAAALPAAEGEALVADPDAATFWHHAVSLDPKQARFAFTWLIGDRVKLAEDSATTITASALDPKTLVAVGKLVADGKLSSTNAKTLLADLWTGAADPLERATQLGLLQESNEGELAKVVDGVIAANAQAVADYKAGNQRAFGA